MMYDYVDNIIRYENGELDDTETVELFRYLLKSGYITGLQGSTRSDFCRTHQLVAIPATPPVDW